VDAAFSAERLLLARQRRGYNKTKLANLVGVKAPTITAWERAEREPADKVIDTLANALDFPRSFFFEEMGDPLFLEAASFRSLSRMTASQRDAALASGTLAMHLNDWIAARFDLPAPDVPALDPGVHDPAGAAHHVRTRWGLGNLPIANVLQMLEGHGVRVYALSAECREVDAFSFWHQESETPFIIVGTHKTPERQVFDLAHELAHLVLHRDHASPRGRVEEREADAFASSFLMPRDDVFLARPRSTSLQDLAVAKHRWRVSVAALARRLHGLDLISDWQYHSVCVQIASTIGRDREMNSLPREQSQVLPQVFGPGGVTRREVAEALHVPVAEIDALLGGLVLSALDGGEERTDRRANLRLV
jgi:Zn-dependent peptidase ImmA (M78 family)/transcriptional regulator with XRE-family HTH domain